MTYSVQKSTVAKIAVISLAVLLAACSSDQRYKRQVSGDEAYLDSPPLVDIHAPAGMILPVENGTYNLPPIANSSGAVGKQLDIRPPAQPLALGNGTRAQFSGDTATLQVDSAHSSGLWQQVITILQSKNYLIAKRNDAGQTLTTDWVAWNRADEDLQYRGRYQINVTSQDSQPGVTVKLVNLEQAGKPISDPGTLQRYNAEMVNVISAGLDKADTDRKNAQDNRVAGQLDVQSGADDTGLPMLVVRAPFNVVWNRLPAALKKVGMEVRDTTRSQGSLEIGYSTLSDEGWRGLGIRDPGLANGIYKLQVGDLDNRSSLQFIDPKGHTLTQSQNDALVSVFQAAFR